MLFLLLNRLELLFTYTAKGANPIFGEIFKCDTRLNALFGITDCGVVNPLAHCTIIFFHNPFYLK